MRIRYFLAIFLMCGKNIVFEIINIIISLSRGDLVHKALRYQTSSGSIYFIPEERVTGQGVKKSNTLA